ncbi:helix-turn-helix transcriptional regulator [Bacillus paralicheniformis]|uniref:helix-turn-helix domain-containing protein n=1 Tax=Bacillus TaxID=1386 RepID=UPI0013EF3FB2|nr:MULTISPECIES: helix-turn-helix transcriptional regulator [Bacillus]MCY8609943.1 helix-turn-helix transcriptional regulator [Bacillus haynesii]MEC0752178.1 helix-turn-helix transcriptional regulator [Bacillus haynesii]QII49528.1 helix-turn-helix transcriptional regulator [Bacillus paralicheniformis]
MNLGQKIKQLRKANGMNQGQLAEAINIHQTAVSQFELNKKKPGRDTLIKLSKLFEVPLEYLVDDDEKVNYSDSEKSFVNEYTKLFPSELNFKVSEIAEKYKTKNDEEEALLTKEEAEEAVRYIQYLLSKRNDK